MAQKRKNKRKKSRKWIYWILMLILFVGAAIMCYFVWDMYFRAKDDGGSGSSGQSVVEKKEEKKGEEIIEEIPKEDKTEVVEKEKVVQYEGEDPNGLEELTGAVTYAGVNGDSLVIRVNIDQFLSEGDCTLSLVKNGVEEYSDMVEIMASVSTSSCDGFNVPVSALSGGSYNIVINLESAGKVGFIKGEANI